MMIAIIAAACVAGFTLGLVFGLRTGARHTSGTAQGTMGACQSMSMSKSPGSSKPQTPIEFNQGRTP